MGLPISPNPIYPIFNMIPPILTNDKPGLYPRTYNRSV
jgi:hypothetical protein